MRKEVLIAIIIGFGLGLVITFGIWTANQSMKKVQEEELPELADEEIPTPIPTPELSLLISSPEDNAISTEETIEVSGQTVASGVVVVLYPDGEKIIEANKSGQFSTEIDLAGGDNEITVMAFDQDNNEISKTLTVVFSTAEI